jgi:hypothetical protein
MALYSNVPELRKRILHYLEPGVAAGAGMSMDQLIQFGAGAFQPTPEQIHLLAIRTRLYPPGLDQ